MCCKLRIAFHRPRYSKTTNAKIGEKLSVLHNIFMYWYFTASGGYDAFRALYPSFCTSRASADSTETNLMQIDTAPSVAAVTPPHDLSEPSTSPVTSYMKGDTIKYRPSQDQVILSHSLFSSLVKLSLIKLSFSLPNWCCIYMEHVHVCNWVLRLYVQPHVSFAY